MDNKTIFKYNNFFYQAGVESMALFRIFSGKRMIFIGKIPMLLGTLLFIMSDIYRRLQILPASPMLFFQAISLILYFEGLITFVVGYYKYKDKRVKQIKDRLANNEFELLQKIQLLEQTQVHIDNEETDLLLSKGETLFGLTISQFLIIKKWDELECCCNKIAKFKKTLYGAEIESFLLQNQLISIEECSSLSKCLKDRNIIAHDENSQISEDIVKQDCILLDEIISRFDLRNDSDSREKNEKSG